MERLSPRKPSIYLASVLSTTAFSACSVNVDSYLTNPADVQCDGKRTKVDLENEGQVIFVVHGKEEGDVATIKVRRSADAVSVSTSGDVTGPPQRVEEDGYTKPTPIVTGSELSTFGAGGAWTIDAREDSVVIQGSCDGM